MEGEYLFLAREFSRAIIIEIIKENSLPLWNLSFRMRAGCT